MPRVWRGWEKLEMIVVPVGVCQVPEGGQLCQGDAVGLDAWGICQGEGGGRDDCGASWGVSGS